MKYNALHDAGRFSKLRRNRKRWQKVVSVMASIVVFCTTYALILPAITMEQPDTYCGLENHIHGPECYEKVLTCDHAGDDVVEATPMANVTEGHTHDETCYEEIKTLICEQEEVVGHKHDSSCETLICSLEETSGHSHSDACYEIQYETKTWTEEVTVNDGEELTCTSTEEGHAHDGSCYTAKSHTETVEHTEQVEVGRVLTCTTPESAPHSHDASCYQMVCTQEEVEGHTHTDECYTVEQGELICEIPEVTEAPETTEPEVTDPAEPAHEHSDACYEEKLICGCEIEHEHTADCYIEPPYEPADNEALVCELEEHKHDDACLIAETGELICELEEHSHDENCYEQLPAFEMWLPLDADIDLDVYTEKHEYIDEDGLYGVTVYAKPDTFDVPVTLEVELLEEDDDRYVNALDVLAAQVEETEEAEEEIVDEAADELAAIDEVTPENTLPEEPAEPASEAPVAEEEVVEDEVIEEEIIEEEVIEEEITAQPALTGEEGMIAFDIHFVDEDGDEVQPLEPVYVHIQAMGLLPEDVDLSTVTVQHIREEQPATFWGRMMDMIPFVDETVYIPEVVADMIDEDLGWIDFEPNMDDDEIYDVNTAFEVDGFSTFTITWTSGQTYSLTVVTVDTDGQDLTINDTISTDFTGSGFDSWRSISDFMVQAGFDSSYPGCTFVGAYQNRSLTTEVNWIRFNSSKNTKWRYSTTQPSSDSGGSGISTLYLVYEAAGASLTADVKLVDRSESTPVTTDGTDINITNKGTLTNIRNYASNQTSDGTTYVYDKAYVTTGGSEVYITAVRYDAATQKWYYTVDNDATEIDFNPAEEPLTIVYKDNGLHEVATVDSTSKGMYVYMFDYFDPSLDSNTGKNTMNGDFGDTRSYGNGTTNEGLLTNTTLGTGEYYEKYPALSGTTSTATMKKYFGIESAYRAFNNATPANHLFLKSEYDATGDLYYNSFDNFAEFDESTGNFTVYEELGSPSRDSNYYYQRGNFFPYNTLNPDKVINKNLYDSLGQELPSDDDRYNEDVYGFNESSNNYYFGMYAYATFYQPVDGQVTRPDGSKEDMIFKFTGDDDLWIYIDGQLVLDIGGVHDAQNGEINFATGVVRWTDTPNDDRDNAVWRETTIKDMFNSADGVNWKGNTFADGSFHTFQMFYMERGAGASNCMIRLNLPTVPNGTMSVRKNVENYSNALMQNIEYTMELKDADGAVVPNAAYYLMSAPNTTLYTDTNGRFPLGHDETAVFEGLGGNKQYTVTEVAITPVDENRLDEYKLDYVVKDSSGNTVASAQDQNTKSVTVTTPAAGSAAITFTNKAQFTDQLVITKNFTGTENNEAPDGFNAQFQLQELVEGNWVDVEGVVIPYSAFTNGSYTLWLEVGKTYRVVENVIATGNTETLVYRSTSVTSNDSDEGWVELATTDKDTVLDTIAFINDYGEPVTEIDLTKVVTVNGKDPDATKDAALLNTEYTFHVTIPGAAEGDMYTVTYTDDRHTDGEVAYNATNGLVVKLYHNETATISGQLSGKTVTFTEQNTNGYSVSWKLDGANAQSGAEQTAVVGTNASVTCTNTTGYALPSTGGIGTTLYTMSGMAMMSAALVGGYGLRRKRERGSEE